MTELISTAIFQPFQLTSNITFTVIDPHDVGGRTVTIDAGWYYLGTQKNAGGDGALTNPWKFTSTLQSELNTGSGGGNYWTVSLLSTGKISIACSDAGQLTWSASGGAQVANICGFPQSDLTFSNETRIASTLPLFTFYSVCRSGDTGWTDSPGYVAAVELADGRVDAIRSSYQQWARSFKSRFHPSTVTDDGAGSPYYSARHATTATSTATATIATTLTPPWSVVDFLQTAAGLPCAFVHTWNAASFTSFDIVYLSLETLTAQERSVPTIQNWSGRRDTGQLKILGYSLGESV